MPDLRPLFQPGAIAVVGASSKAGSFGGQVLRNLQSGGFAGALYGVHPREQEIFGIRAYPSLADLPQVPDCAALAVANRHLLSLLEQAIGLGIPAAILFGDPNVGPDRDPDLQGRIEAMARENQITICGPNSMGLYASRHRLAISGYPIQPDSPSGQIALITHSGTVFDSVSQNNRDLRFNYLVSAGNEAGLTAADYLRYVCDDPDTGVAALYLETVRDPKQFMQALAHARRRGLPVVILKTGRSERGRQLAQAHSGALSGSARTYAALFRHFGVCQVRTLDEMMDTLELFSKVQTVRPPSCAVLMESGGERSLLVDIAADLGLALAEFSTETKARLAEIVEPGVALENPLDAFGSGRQVVETYRGCLQALDADPQTGLNLLAVDLARFSNLSPAYTQAAIEALPALRNPLAALVNVTAGASESLMAELRSHGIPVLMGTETGLKAIGHLAAFSAFEPESLAAAPAAGRPTEEVVRRLRERIAASQEALGEYESIQVLSAYGLPAIPMAAAGSLTAVLESAADFGYPLALKTAEPGLAHKSDAGGVQLGIRDQPALEAAYGALCERFGPHVLLQPMAQKGVEMYFGMSRDPQFGAVLYFGFGGIYLELYQDVVAALPVLSQAGAGRLLRELKGFPRLCGFRGGPVVDLDQLAGWMALFAAFVRDMEGLLAEVDINPLIVSASGAQIVDALLVPRQPTP